MRASSRRARCGHALWSAGLLLVLGATQGGAQVSADAAAAPPPRTSSAETVHPYAAHVAEASRRFGLPEVWIWAVMRVESGGKSRAVSSAGAMGLMQIMPATWAELTARHGLGDDPFDIRANILAGAAYLRAMLDRYGEPALALAAYNAGPGRVDDWRTNGRALPAETIAYVARIMPALGTISAAPPAIARAGWREAGLFPERAAGSPKRSAGAASPAISSGPGAPSAVPPRADPNNSLPSASLFVPLSGPLDQ